MTYEIAERIGSQGEVVKPLDEAATIETIRRAGAARVEAVAVCLLWSIVNAAHEKRLGELIAEHLPGVPFTLSHALNPSIREYRRASSAAIDASLKPLMGTYLKSVSARLRAEGLPRDVLVVTSAGGVLPAIDVGASPIHSLASGPAAAPVAGRRFAAAVGAREAVIVTDAGGTSFDVSLVRKGQIPWTRETKIGRSYLGPMTGFPSVDVKSIGAGGGSIAWVDAGGLLHVGPESAGAVPGPACYGKGGTRPTATDACLVLGYLDPDFFLGGAMPLYPEKAIEAVIEHVANPLGIGVREAADAMITLSIEHMVNAIEDIAINQGVDPRGSSIVIGGGSGGFYGSAILKRLKASQAIVPQGAAALSAVGALISGPDQPVRRDPAGLDGALPDRAGQHRAGSPGSTRSGLPRCHRRPDGVTGNHLLGRGALSAADVGPRSAAAATPLRFGRGCGTTSRRRSTPCIRTSCRSPTSSPRSRQ